ncbi:hypothetical protein MRS44_013242 [Fusarium solani]|uniref:uncharacterized protein n=1 Tax=Fusarium solani TaxID=169388 RepID=UPI0032C46DA9|nr:hypothetical protein MRS44_013242 [Fusarium solani]
MATSWPDNVALLESLCLREDIQCVLAPLLTHYLDPCEAWATGYQEHATQLGTYLRQALLYLNADGSRPMTPEQAKNAIIGSLSLVTKLQNIPDMSGFHTALQTIHPDVKAGLATTQQIAQAVYIEIQNATSATTRAMAETHTATKEAIELGKTTVKLARDLRASEPQRTYASIAARGITQATTTPPNLNPRVSPSQTLREVIVNIRDPTTITSLRAMNPRNLKAHVDRAIEQSGNEHIQKIKIASSNQLKSGDLSIKTTNTTDTAALKEFAEDWEHRLGQGASVRIPTYGVLAHGIRISSMHMEKQKATATASSLAQPLSDAQYDAGFGIFIRDSGWVTYRDFIIPQLSLLLAPLFNSRTHTSVLEIGPGPKSVLGYLPGYLRRKVSRYATFEPNDLFATRLEEWLCSASDTESSLPCLQSSPGVHRSPFVLNSNIKSCTGTGTSDGVEKFDVILFCHSMYGMKSKRRFIEQALEMLVERPEGGMVVVFHRDGALHFDGLECHRTASFPTGVIRVANDDEVLDCFAPFVAGFFMQDVDVNKAIRVEWRKICRALGRREEAHPDHLLFSSPNVMAAFTQHATTLPELTAQVPLVNGDCRGC